jgi:hypothetical protein
MSFYDSGSNPRTQALEFWLEIGDCSLTTTVLRCILCEKLTLVPANMVARRLVSLDVQPG